MYKGSMQQKYFVDSLNASTNIDRLKELSEQRLLQLAFMRECQTAIIHQLKSLCRELPVNYRKRFVVQDKFLTQLDDEVLALCRDSETISMLTESIDQFCAGDIQALDEINGT